MRHRIQGIPSTMQLAYHAYMQSLTGLLQRPARRWMRRLGVRVHLRLLLQGARSLYRVSTG